MGGGKGERGGLKEAVWLAKPGQSSRELQAITVDYNGCKVQKAACKRQPKKIHSLAPAAVQYLQLAQIQHCAEPDECSGVDKLKGAREDNNRRKSEQ